MQHSQLRLFVPICNFASLLRAGDFEGVDFGSLLPFLPFSCAAVLPHGPQQRPSSENPAYRETADELLVTKVAREEGTMGVE